jgi:probable phosphoglycerate mutase
MRNRGASASRSAATISRVEILLIRHALPRRVENADGRPADPPLSDEGREQARRLAAWLASDPLDAIYASPLRRAAETAAPLAAAKGIEVVTAEGIAEYDAASPVYVPLEELKAADPAAWRAAVQGGLYAGIDIEAFARTVVASVEEIVAAHPGGRVAVVCHGGVVNAWAAHVLGIPRPLFFEPTYTSVSRFVAARSGERSIVSLGETAHLRLGARRDR